MSSILKKRETTFNIFRMAVIALLSLGIFIFSGCDKKQDIPHAKKGVLDLRNWNFQEDGPVRLDGEWSFYWKQLIDPENTGNSSPSERLYVHVPFSWDSETANGQIPGSGFATYHLTILLNNSNSELAFKFNNIHTAHTAYLNGRKINSNGKVGETRDSSRAEVMPSIVQFNDLSKRLEVVIHVSNFSHKSGGIITPISLGRKSDIINIYEKKLITDFILLGSIFIISLYYFSMYLFRKENRAFLYFSLFCFITIIRLLVTGNIPYKNIIDAGSWELLYNLAILSFYMAVPIFLRYIYFLYPDEFSKKILWFIQVSALIFSLSVIFFDPLVYSKIVPLFNILTIASSLYVIYIITISAIHKKKGAAIFLLGFSVLFASIFNDILYDNQVIQTGFLSPAGLLCFIIFQAYILSMLFADSMITMEKMSGELDENNEELIKAMDELETTQERLIQQEKKAAVGNLARGLAHEINNQLHAISFLEFIDKDFNEEEKKYVKYIYDSRDRITSMVNEVRALAKNEEAHYSIPVSYTHLRAHET